MLRLLGMSLILGTSIVLAAPDWMRARCAVVSGSIRSMKKRAVTSFAL